MNSQTFLTVADAAVRVGKSRQTLFDKIKRGQLSATVNHDGVKVVEVSELLRVFGTLLSDDEVKKNQTNKTGQPELTAQTSALQLELERAKLHIERRDFEIEQLRARIEEMKERERQSIDDRTKLLGIIDRQTLLLAAPKAPRATTKAKPAASKAPPASAVKSPSKAAPALVVKKAAPVKSKTVAKKTATTVAKKATKK